MKKIAKEKFENNLDNFLLNNSILTQYQNWTKKMLLSHSLTQKQIILLTKYI
jgi:hypothetical protein